MVRTSTATAMASMVMVQPGKSQKALHMRMLEAGELQQPRVRSVD